MHQCTAEGCEKVFMTRRQLAGHMGWHVRKRVPIPHGTPKGYVYHVRRRVPIDRADSCGCREAHARMQRERRQALRDRTSLRMP